MDKAKVKTVYHQVEVNAYDSKDAFTNAVDKIKNSKALYQGGTFKDKAEKVKKVKEGSKPKVKFEKTETKAVKQYEIDGVAFIDIKTARAKATQICLEQKRDVKINIVQSSYVAYKTTHEMGTMGRFSVQLVEENVPFNG